MMIRRMGYTGLEPEYDRILMERITPAMVAMGFRPRGKGRQTKTFFHREESDRICQVSFAGDRLDLIVLTVTFPPLAELLNQYRVSCGEQPLGRDGWSHLWDQVRLTPMPHPPDEASAQQQTRTIEKSIREHFASQPATLEELAKLWSPTPEYRTVQLAGIYWLLGEQEKAKELLQTQKQRLNEILKTKVHPPSHAQRIEIEFFERFLGIA
jgi:hypothetical protein